MLSRCPKCGCVVFAKVGHNKWRCTHCGHDIVLGGREGEGGYLQN